MVFSETSIFRKWYFEIGIFRKWYFPKTFFSETVFSETLFSETLAFASLSRTSGGWGWASSLSTPPHPTDRHLSLYTYLSAHLSVLNTLCLLTLLTTSNLPSKMPFFVFWQFLYNSYVRKILTTMQCFILSKLIKNCQTIVEKMHFRYNSVCRSKTSFCWQKTLWFDWIALLMWKTSANKKHVDNFFYRLFLENKLVDI